MEKREGHAVPIVPEATVVPGGVVRLTELQEQDLHPAVRRRL
jgi:hypothetical protein